MPQCLWYFVTSWFTEKTIFIYFSSPNTLALDWQDSTSMWHTLPSAIYHFTVKSGNKLMEGFKLPGHCSPHNLLSAKFQGHSVIRLFTLAESRDNSPILQPTPRVNQSAACYRYSSFWSFLHEQHRQIVTEWLSCVEHNKPLSSIFLNKTSKNEPHLQSPDWLMATSWFSIIRGIMLNFGSGRV